MHNLIAPSSKGSELCAELIRRKILHGLKCPANLLNFNLAIDCVRNGRLTFKYGHQLLADVFGYFRTEDAKRKAIQRLITRWLDFQRDSGYRLQQIKRGGCKSKELTTYGIDHIQPAVEWIREQVAGDPEYGIALPEVLIDRYVEQAISRLPQTAPPLSPPKRKQTATTVAGGRLLISRDDLTPFDPPSQMCLVALDYHHRGFKVFPAHTVKEGVCSCKLGADCQNKGKHPRMTGWQSWAETAGDTQIRELWHKYPDANVAIKTGGKLAVMDVDPRSGGHVEWKHLTEYNGIDMPETFRVRTGSGGFHLYFHTAEPLRSRQLAKGVDFKASGGYVIAPGSVHANGNKYEVEIGAPLAQIPEKLLQLIDQTQPQRSIPQGDRHNFLVKCARAMAGEGISREKILPLLAERRRHCALGNRQITDQELDGIAGWALDAEYGKQVFVRKAAA